MTPSSRYLSLRDYLRVLREHRLLIVVMTAVFVIVANRISNEITPSYRAEAAVALGSLSTDQTLAGLPAGNQDQLPIQTPAINAESIGIGPILGPATAEVRHRGFRFVTPSSLHGAVSARVEAQSNLIIIQASSHNPRLAQAEANAVANADVAYVRDQERARFAAAASQLRSQLASVQHSSTDQAERAAYADQIARLKSLVKFAQGAQVTEGARLPKNPTSPNPVRDSILAGLVGLTLAVIIAFLRSALDRRVRSARQIQRELGLTLLGRIGASAMGRAAASKSGRRRMTPEDLEAFRILQSNLEYLAPGRELKSIAVTSPLPQEGKSTVAAALAFTSYWTGRRTLLIEADLRRPSIAARTGIPSEPGLHELLTESATLSQVVHRMPISPQSKNGDRPDIELPESVSLDVIPAGSKPQLPAELLGSEAFAELLKEAAQYYDMVILDTAPLLPVADTLKVLPRVEAVLVCVRVGRTRGEEIRATRDALEHLPERPAGLVLTGMRRGDEEDYGYYPATSIRASTH